MATVSRDLPEQPHLDVPKREARELLNLCRKSDPDALEGSDCANVEERTQRKERR